MPPKQKRSVKSDANMHMRQANMQMRQLKKDLEAARSKMKKEKRENNLVAWRVLSAAAKNFDRMLKVAKQQVPDFGLHFRSPIVPRATAVCAQTLPTELGRLPRPVYDNYKGEPIALGDKT